MNVIGQNGKQKIYKGTVYNEKPVVDYVSNNNKWMGQKISMIDVN